MAEPREGCWEVGGAVAVLVPVVRDGLPEEMRLVGMLERSSRIS